MDKGPDNGLGFAQKINTFLYIYAFLDTLLFFFSGTIKTYLRKAKLLLLKLQARADSIIL